MQELTIRTAELSDLDSIMNIEENGFIPEIQEEGQVFEARIKACPELFLIFEAASYNGTANSGGVANTSLDDNTNCTDNTNSETEVCSDAHNTNSATPNSNRSPAGYLCAELMSRIPETPQDVALGHTPEGTPAVEGACTTLETSAQLLTAAQLSAPPAQTLTPHQQPNSSILYISSFSLLPAFRGNGNGTRAWQRAMSYFENRFPHISTYVLLVNKDWSGAAHIYTKSGFKEYKVLKDFFPRQDNSRSDGILMIKSISPKNS